MTTPVTFVNETRDELKKVKWPTRDDVVRLTFIVILVSIIVGLFLGGLDFLFTSIMDLVLRN